MGLFRKKNVIINKDNSESNQALAIQNQIPNSDLLYISDLPASKIPHFGAGVFIVQIVIEKGKPVIKEEEKLDPSTIFRKLPISIPESVEDVESLPYWPSYAGMSPEQRFVYLDWLKDVSKPIDPGYVFVYYYGLERQLLFGNFEKAFNEIIMLRKNHKNKSFGKYSETALICACFYKDRLDLLLKNYGEASMGRFSNLQLEFAAQNNLNLSAENLISIFKELRLYRSPIVGYEDTFLGCLNSTLESEYNADHLPFGLKYLEKVKEIKEQGFANYSFPDEFRNPIVNDILNNKDFKTEITRIYNIAYEDFKKEKALLRKSERSNLSNEEKQNIRHQNEVKRLNKLYSSNILKKHEYELLMEKLKSSRNEDNSAKSGN